MKNQSKKPEVISRYKVCPNPHCEAVFHFIPKKITRCDNCDSHLVEINEKAYLKKFASEIFQYDFRTGNLINQNQEELE